MARHRGFGQSGVTDLIVAPELGTLLRSARLPSHVVLAAAATVSPFPDLSRGKWRQTSFEWFWWTVPYERVDFAQSAFEVHEKDGTVEEARFECFEDYEQVRKRSIRSHFAIIPKTVHWLGTNPSDDSVDLEPIEHDKWRISSALAEAIRGADLPGIQVND